MYDHLNYVNDIYNNTSGNYRPNATYPVLQNKENNDNFTLFGYILVNLSRLFK